MQIFSRGNLILWTGDLVTVVGLTLVGFATHDQLSAGSERILATFLPVLASWVFTALPAGILQAQAAVQPRSLWQAAWAMSLAGVLASVLRGFMLNRPVAPIFAFVLSGSAVLAILIWRALFLLLMRRMK